MTFALRAVTFVIAASISAGSAAATGDFAKIPNLNRKELRQHCLMVSQIFSRLAEQREAGRQEAAFRVRQWAGSQGQTGSHITPDFSAAVDNASHFVFAHPELNRATLGHYGYRACGLQYRFADSPSKSDASMLLLLSAAHTCQAENPGNRFNKGLAQCMRIAVRAVSKQVQQSKVVVR